MRVQRTESRMTNASPNRIAKALPRRNFHPAQARHIGTIEELVAELRPVLPLYVLRPEILAQKAQEFKALFPGDVMYAVKVNPEKLVLQTLHRNGINAFDVASIEEVRLTARAAPKAKLYFMHPVKSPEAIREAYAAYGVRAFVLDTQDELYKILQATDLAPDLELFVRIGLPKNESAAIDFSAKFGASPEDAVLLLRQARAVSTKLGLCFHIGSQTLDPRAYEKAIGISAKAIADSGVKVDVLDIGGGFPAAYPGEAPPPLTRYMKAIAEAIRKNGLEDLPLLSEPGRVLVAPAGSLVVRVEQRRGDLLYINDGTYGGLFDAGPPLNTKFPVRALRPDKPKGKAPLAPFRFAGPTCDSLDMMPGPFMLPDDMATGDWIEIQNLGAYSITIRGNFNGFGKCATAALYSQPPVTKTKRLPAESRQKT